MHVIRSIRAELIFGILTDKNGWHVIRSMCLSLVFLRIKDDGTLSVPSELCLSLVFLQIKDDVNSWLGLENLHSMFYHDYTDFKQLGARTKLELECW